MGYILFGLLVLISIGCFMEGKTVERRGVEFLFSISSAAILSVVMSASTFVLIQEELLKEGFQFILVGTVLPALAFGLFQLLLFKIKPFE